MQTWRTLPTCSIRRPDWRILSVSTCWQLQTEDRKTLGLKQIIAHHVDFVFEVNSRKYTTLLAKEQEKREIQEGLIKACDVIDLIIEILRGSKSRDQVKKCLTDGITEGIKFKTKTSEKAAKSLKFTEKQATAILDMRLYKLIGLEIDALMKEHEETMKEHCCL